LAEEEAAGPLKIEMPPVPINFDLSKEYYPDAAKMASHMKYVGSSRC